MRRKLTSILSALIVISLSAMPVFAGRGHLSAVTFSLGSPQLNAEGFYAGGGGDDHILTLEASGIPIVTCFNQGGNFAPGQDPPRFSANGTQLLSGDDPFQKNGKSPFDVTTAAPLPQPGEAWGCPNDNWMAEIVFVLWDTAVLSVALASDPSVEIFRQEYACVTTPPPFESVSCTPVD